MVAVLKLVPPPSSRPTLIRVWVSEPEKPWGNNTVTIEFRIGDALSTEIVECEFDSERCRLVDAVMIPEWIRDDVKQVVAEAVFNGANDDWRFGGWL